MQDDKRRQDFAEIVSNLRSGRARIRSYDSKGNEVCDVTEHVVRLLLINKGWLEPSDERYSLFLTSGRAETVTEGRKINDRYGEAGLRAAHKAVDDILPDGAGRELEAAWSSIGNWFL